MGGVKGQYAYYAFNHLKPGLTLDFFLSFKNIGGVGRKVDGFSPVEGLGFLRVRAGPGGFSATILHKLTGVLYRYLKLVVTSKILEREEFPREASMTKGNRGSWIGTIFMVHWMPDS